MPSRARRCWSLISRTQKILAGGTDSDRPRLRHDACVTTETRARLQRGLVVVGIVVLAFNLRPAAVSVGPVLSDVSDGLGMTAAETGVLTSLPVLAFAVFGALAPRLARLVGLHRLTLVALLAVVGGLWLRPTVTSVPLFLALSLLALAGMASANVLMPSLVKLHFPDRVGLMTAIYSTALAIGLTSASVLTVPISESFDGWSSGLVAWSFTAAIAVLPWLGLIGHDRKPEEVKGHIGLLDVARTRLGWMMALFFGLQSLQAYSIFGWFAELYQEAGFSAHTSGLLLGVITGVSIPLSFLIPSIAARVHSQAVLICSVMACYPIGYIGLMVAPSGALAWVWAVLVGVGTTTFPLILTLLGLRARTPAGTAALSGFAQSTGYLIAGTGPFSVGLLHDLSGGWTVPLLALLLLNIPQLWLGLAVSRPAYIEDELTDTAPHRTRPGR